MLKNTTVRHRLFYNPNVQIFCCDFCAGPLSSSQVIATHEWTIFAGPSTLRYGCGISVMNTYQNCDIYFANGFDVRFSWSLLIKAALEVTQIWYDSKMNTTIFAASDFSECLLVKCCSESNTRLQNSTDMCLLMIQLLSISLYTRNSCVVSTDSKRQTLCLLFIRQFRDFVHHIYVL